MGFSRQEHWSGVPFLSPMHESEKWKWSHSVVSDPQRPHGLQPTRLLHPWDFPVKSTGVGCHFLLRIFSLGHSHQVTRFWDASVSAGLHSSSNVWGRNILLAQAQLACLWAPEFSPSVVFDSSATPWTIARQAPLSMEFSRQEYSSRVPFSSLRTSLAIDNMIFAKF